MTTYTAVADSEIDTDSPLTESLFTRLRDNPIAITEGATGSPKITDAAFNTNSINADKLVNNSITASQIAASGVDSDELAASCVGYSKLNVIATRGLSQSLGSGSVYTFSKGLWLVLLPATGIWLQYYDGATWNNLIDGATSQCVTVLGEDAGSDFRYRLYNSSGGTLTYSRIKML